jgi:hypothetical protein
VRVFLVTANKFDKTTIAKVANSLDEFARVHNSVRLGNSVYGDSLVSGEIETNATVLEIQEKANALSAVNGTNAVCVMADLIEEFSEE